MMSFVSRLALASLLALNLLACDSGRVTPTDGGPMMDAPIAPIDGGLGSMGEGGPSSDGGPMSGDAAPFDAGVDGGPPPCECPPLPETCTLPEADELVFTPEGESLEQLFDVIACANTSLDLAIYQATWDCVVEALLERLDQAPDLELRVVVDNDQCPLDGTGQRECALRLLDGHAEVIDDNRSGLMHHKFLVADSERLWVSSANFSENSFCRDYNNSIVIEEEAIVARYQHIFDRFMGLTEEPLPNGPFGPVPPEGPVTAGHYTVYFSPESTSAMAPQAWFTAMLDAIDGADTSIEVMISAWTRNDIAAALIAAEGRGVEVRALVSHLFRDWCPAQRLLEAGVPIRSTFMHSKMMVIDGETVITGSANWSNNAFGNNENSLWIESSTHASEARAELERIWPSAREIAAADCRNPDGP